MRKLFYFAILSFFTFFFFFALHVIIVYPEKGSLIPANLRLNILNEIFSGGDISSLKSVFIVGTSHVGVGFEECANDSIARSFELSMSADVSIQRANALMLISSAKKLENVNLILEVTLIDSVAGQNKLEKSLIYSYLVDEFSGISSIYIMSSFLKNKFHSNSTNCDLQKIKSKGFYADLLGSQILSNTMSDSEISFLFSEYKESLKKLVHVCEHTNNARITLVSLPIHPELYSIKKVQHTFNKIELSMQSHLDSIKATSSCDISYINLATLGAEFPDQKFWADPGHFLPEVGERVLQEIELFHAKKKPH